MRESKKGEVRSFTDGVVFYSPSHELQDVKAKYNYLCIGDSHILSPGVALPFDEALMKCHSSARAGTLAKNGATIAEIAKLLDGDYKEYLPNIVDKSNFRIILSAGINDVFRADDLGNLAMRYEGLIEKIREIFGEETQIICLAVQAWAHAYTNGEEENLHNFREDKYPAAAKQMKNRGKSSKRDVLIASTEAVNSTIEQLCERLENLYFCEESYLFTKRMADRVKARSGSILFADEQHFCDEVIYSLAISVADFLCEQQISVGRERSISGAEI